MQLSGAYGDPRHFDAIRGVVQSLESVDAAQITEAARLYLKDNAEFKLQVVPEANAAETPSKDFPPPRGGGDRGRGPRRRLPINRLSRSVLGGRALCCCTVGAAPLPCPSPSRGADSRA